MKNKKVICLICAFIFSTYVLSLPLKFKCDSIFFGVCFNDNPIYYANVIYLLGLIVFFSFGETEKYVNGYGVLEVVRSKKRKDIIRNIIFMQVKNAFIIVTFVNLFFVIMAEIEGKIQNNFFSLDVIYSFVIFLMIALSISMVQSIFEMIFDSRVGVIITLFIISIQIYGGDYLFLHETNKYIYVIINCNYAFTARRGLIEVNRIVTFISILLICMAESIILNSLYKRKDIIGIK